MWLLERKTARRGRSGVPSTCRPTKCSERHWAICYSARHHAVAGMLRAFLCCSKLPVASMCEFKIACCKSLQPRVRREALSPRLVTPLPLAHLAANALVPLVRRLPAGHHPRLHREPLGQACRRPKAREASVGPACASRSALRQPGRQNNSLTAAWEGCCGLHGRGGLERPGHGQAAEGGEARGGGHFLASGSTSQRSTTTQSGMAGQGRCHRDPIPCHAQHASLPSLQCMSLASRCSVLAVCALTSFQRAGAASGLCQGSAVRSFQSRFPFWAALCLTILRSTHRLVRVDLHCAAQSHFSAHSVAAGRGGRLARLPTWLDTFKALILMCPPARCRTTEPAAQTHLAARKSEAEASRGACLAHPAHECRHPAHLLTGARPAFRTLAHAYKRCRTERLHHLLRRVGRRVSTKRLAKVAVCWEAIWGLNKGKLCSVLHTLYSHGMGMAEHRSEEESEKHTKRENFDEGQC